MSSRPTSSSVIASADNIFITHEGRHLLHDVSLKVIKGAINMVLGHNGAGKTLLLSTLHGLIKPQRGNISGPIRKKQKMVFQKPVVLRRSARDYFEFLCPELDENIVLDWFKKAQLEAKLTTPARQLSGGETQKLALIGALATNPDLLFLDEPSAHLDFESTSFIESQIKAAHYTGTTIVMTSHNRAQAERLAEQVLFMENGEIIEAVTAKKFFKSPQSLAAQSYLKHY